MKIFYKSFISLILVVTILLVGFVGSTVAQGEIFFGQNHFYTVTFRGNGEAIVFAKIVIVNPDEKPLTKMSFEVPKVNPTEMSMYQMKLPRECIDYDYNSPGRPCLKWRDPDYTGYYNYRDGETEYQKIDFNKTENNYNLILPTPLEPYKSTAVIIAYSAKGYVDKSMGLYNFSFETIKVPSRIEEINVTVNVDSDLYLRGNKANVDYAPSSSFEDSIVPVSSLSSRSLDNVVGKIGSYGSLMKKATNLSPNETFVVRGDYSTSWFYLYLKSILITILIIFAIFIGVYLLSILLKRRSKQGVQYKNENTQQQSFRTSQNAIGFFSVIHFAMGLLSFILVVGLTYLIFSFSDNIYNISGPGIAVFGTIVSITVLSLYFLSIFGPAIVVSVRYGAKSLIAVLISEFLWFVLFILIYLIYFRSI